MDPIAIVSMFLGFGLLFTGFCVTVWIQLKNTKPKQ